jgi:hypothetical protein
VISSMVIHSLKRTSLAASALILASIHPSA